eukprot:1160106-Pelagomonas_calceolata.AAC.1
MPMIQCLWFTLHQCLGSLCMSAYDSVPMIHSTPVPTEDLRGLQDPLHEMRTTYRQVNATNCLKAACRIAASSHALAAP